MNCLEIQEMFSAQLDNELSREDAGTLHKHLEICRGCSEEWQEWQRIFGALHSMGERDITAPSGFSSSIMAQIRRENSPSPRINRKRLKQAAIGTAAALLLVSGSMLLKPAPVVNIADMQPSIQSSNDIQPEANLPIADQGSSQTLPIQVASSQPDDSSPVEKSLPTEQGKVLSTGSAEFTSSNDHIVLSTFLKIQVDDAKAAEKRALILAQSQGASVQSLGQQSEGGNIYLVDKFVVNSTQAPGLRDSLAGLGSTISSQEQKEDLNYRYSELLGLLISLEGQRNIEQNNEKIGSLDQQIEQIKKQLRSWDKRSGEQTIVLWIQQ
ncbi:MAG: zf-HC2 domain-containing protein [Syntrophomonadaceae bacterium]